MSAEADPTTRKRLTVAALIGCGLIFSSTLVTSALWRSAVSLDGGLVRSGSIVLLTGSADTQVKSYAFNLLTGSALRPGSTVQAPLVVHNAGSSALDYRLAQTTSSGSAVLAAQLSLRLDVVSGGCPSGVGRPGPVGITATPYDGALVGAATSVPRHLVPGGAETLCVRVGVRSDAPSTVAGTATSVTFTFGAQAS
ncbi:MAG TPA: hypothetical protein VGC37_13755 [Friedmanniella sp.]